MDEIPGPIQLGGVRDSSVARIVGFISSRGAVEIQYPGAIIEGTNQPGLAIPSLYRHQIEARRAASR